MNKTACISIILMALLLPPLIQAQEITGITVQGGCRNFTAAITASGLEGCWDVKIDAPCRIQKPDLEWQSCFYYLQEALCSPDNRTMVRIELEDSGAVNATVQAILRLRQNNTIIEKNFTIQQDCPKGLGVEWGILVSVVLILVFGYALVWWRR